MSLYMRIKEPRETKRAILSSKLNVLKALKRAEEHIQVRKEIKKAVMGMNSMMNSVPNHVNEIRRGLPHIDVGSMGFEKGALKCRICGRSFKTEKGLRQHMKLQHSYPEEEGLDKVRKGSELEKINRQISLLERQLSSLQ